MMFCCLNWFGFHIIHIHSLLVDCKTFAIAVVVVLFLFLWFIINIFMFSFLYFNIFSCLPLSMEWIGWIWMDAGLTKEDILRKK